MRRKMLMLVPIILLALSVVVPAIAEPEMFLVMNCELTDIIFVGEVAEGYLYDVPFEGVAGGPNVKGGTVEGVDHILFDWDGIGHVDIFYTITDNDGDKISVNVVGLSVTQKSGRIVFVDAIATVIDIVDYSTTGKYTGLIGTEFRDEGFVAGLSMDPPGGQLHAKLYWIEA
jgi:hypothetical protein